MNYSNPYDMSERKIPLVRILNLSIPGVLLPMVILYWPLSQWVCIAVFIVMLLYECKILIIYAIEHMQLPSFDVSSTVYNLY